MNSETGEVQTFATHEEALRAGFDVPVELKDLTPEQTDRFIKNQQPVVKPKDTRSKLGKQRLNAMSAKKVLDNKKRTGGKGTNFTPPKKKRKKRK